MTIEAKHFRNAVSCIPYFTYADPNPDFTESLVRLAFDSGAALVEIGIPFSESLADGPVIQTSHFRALSNNRINFMQSALEMVDRLSKDYDQPIVFMAAYNLILQFGERAFFEAAKKASLSGIIIPDLAIDHAKNLQLLSKEFGVQLIFLVTPQSSIDRIEYIAKQSSGFVYVVSTTGITGEQQQLSDSLKSFVSCRIIGRC